MIRSNLDITSEEFIKNFEHNYTTITSQYLALEKSNEVTNITPYENHSSEQALPP